MTEGSKPPGTIRGLENTYLALLAVTSVLLVASVLVIFHGTPNDAQLGFVQKIFYIHLPSAIFGYVGFTVCFVASLVYLMRPSVRVDVVARVGAECGVFFCGMVLITGPFWARKSWNEAWTNEPRLVLTLALFIIFFSHVLVRTYGGRGELPRKIGAVLAIFGFADIPLVHIAVKRWGGNHPRVIEGGGISAEMRTTMILTLVAFGLLFVSLFWARLKAGMLEEEVEILHQEISDLAMEAEVDG